MHTVQKISLKNNYVFPFPGPRWFKKGGRKLLFASRRSDDQRRRKTAGNISDGLRCCIWRRAENPAKMIHSLAGGGNNDTGYITLVHPNRLASRQPEFLAQHRVLAFLGKKICHFIHDFHPDWIARLCLPPSNGQHDQLIPTIQTRILRRIQNLQSRSRKGASALASAKNVLVANKWIHLLLY